MTAEHEPSTCKAVLLAEGGQNSKGGIGGSGHRCNVGIRASLSVPDHPFPEQTWGAFFPMQWRPLCVP